MSPGLQPGALGAGLWAMAKAASHSDVLLRTLSFIGAKRLLTMFADQLRRTPDDQIHTLIATVLASIATLQLPHRPDRIEPRAKKRRPKKPSDANRAARRRP